MQIAMEGGLHPFPSGGIIMLKRLFVLVSIMSVTALAGCNTVRGVGQDVERGGEKLQGAAERAKN
jgi:predicted small secreted protein